MAKRSGMIAQPGERQSHELATPTGGGLGLIFSIVATTVCLQMVIPLPEFWWQNMLPGVVLLAIVGWRDDRFPVSSIIRLLVQLAVSIWLLGFGWWDVSLTDMAFLAVVIVAMVWLMNLYNFMDGSNGMAGFQGVFAGLLLAVFFQNGEQYAMALLALSVAAACAGFLPLNFPQARVFMGDVASVPLGFIFASLTVFGVMTGSLNLPVAILIMSVFIVDATFTLIRRLLRGEKVYEAHRSHAYQYASRQYGSHLSVTLSVLLIKLLLYTM